MPIDRKRRIFRPDGVSLRRSARAALLTVCAGALILSGSAWFGMRPSEAPASTAPPGHVSAAAGQIRVIDGNTLLLRDRTVQLAGVRTARRGTMCEQPGGAYFDCGVAAANALSDLIRDTAIDCALNGEGQSGRPLAVCSAAGQEIALAMVASGWARAEPGATELGDAERRARAERRGLWAGPWAAMD